jgi:hypothetical protein
MNIDEGNERRVMGCEGILDFLLQVFEFKSEAYSGVNAHGEKQK